MLEASLRAWNPWWASGGVPEGLRGTPRDTLPAVLRSLDLPHVKDVIGIRRAGKTTLLLQVTHHLIQAGADPRDAALLNFDDPEVGNAEFDTLLTTLDTINPGIRYLFLDEAQQKPGWERWVRMLHDTKRFEQIFVTGSSSALLATDVSRVLTGRHVSFRVTPFSFKEALAHTGWEAFDRDNLRAARGRLLHHQTRYLEEGGFPDAVGRDAHARKQILTMLFQDVVARDVVARHHATAALAIKVAYHLVTNSAREMSMRRLAQATGVAVDTATHYVDYMVEAHLVLELPRYAHKLSQQFRQPRKFYCVDTGLANAVGFKSSPDSGRLIESAVFLELKRRGAEVYYWKDEKQKEVDFLVKDGAEVTDVIQACHDLTAPRTRTRELAALTAAMDAFGLDQGRIVTWNDERVLETDSGSVTCVPLWAFLLDIA